MKVGRLGELRRYPVKSLEGERLDEVVLGARGLPGDRAWAVRDEVNGGIRGAKKLPALMTLRAVYEAAPAATGSSSAQITFPDGSMHSTTDPEINERLSKAIDHPVSLWPLLPDDALEHYRRGAPTHDDMEQELRAMFARNVDEPLPDLGIFPPEIFEFESPPGTYFDCFPLLLLSEASLQSMAEKAPGSAFDVRRFRPNLVIRDTNGGEFPEQEWRDRRLAIGDAVLRVTIECPRCVMTTHAFADLPKDPGIMRALVREAGGNLGVYATVERPGRIAVGDSLELLGDPD